MYDIENLGRMKNLAVHAPHAMQAFVAFDKAALSEGAIPRKYKELMALAVAFTTQCPYYIEMHSNNARDRRVGSGNRRNRAYRGSVARGWGDHPRHTCHEGNLNGKVRKEHAP